MSRTPKAVARQAAEALLGDMAYVLRDHAAGYFPSVIGIRFKLDPAAEEGMCGPGGRSRARGYFDLDSDTIGLATVLAWESPERQAAIILHELGHAVDALESREAIQDVIGTAMGRLGAEGRADVIGGFLSGQGHELRYDADWTQTLGHGRARPGPLPR